MQFHSAFFSLLIGLMLMSCTSSTGKKPNPPCPYGMECSAPMGLREIKLSWKDTNADGLLQASEWTGSADSFSRAWATIWQSPDEQIFSERMELPPSHWFVVPPGAKEFSRPEHSPRWQYFPTRCYFDSVIRVGEAITLETDSGSVDYVVSTDVYDWWTQTYIMRVNALKRTMPGREKATTAYRNPYQCLAIYYVYAEISILSDRRYLVDGNGERVVGVEAVIAAIPVNEAAFLVRRNLGEDIPTFKDLGTPATEDWNFDKLSTYVIA